MKFSYSNLLLFVFIFSLGACQNKKKSSTIDYSFFIAGHTYGALGVNNPGVHPPFKKKFDWIKNDLSIQLGVFTGDIVLWGSPQNWDEIEADINSLDMPIYFAPGNHEMTNKSLFIERYGPTYKSFVHHSDLFIILDPNIDKLNISGNQLQFLKDVLAKNHQNVDNIFVFFHQLLWRTKSNSYKNVRPNRMHGSKHNFWTEVEPLFSNLANPVYMFAGDVGTVPDHQYMYHNYDNITLISSGMGGLPQDNIVIADVYEDKTIQFRLIPLYGNDLNALGKLEDYVLP